MTKIIHHFSFTSHLFLERIVWSFSRDSVNCALELCVLPKRRYSTSNTDLIVVFLSQFLAYYSPRIDIWQSSLECCNVTVDQEVHTLATI